jgi:hypothetical protein
MGAVPNTVLSADRLPLTQGAVNIASLIGHLVEESRNPGRSRFGRSHRMQRLAEPLTVLPTVRIAAKLAVPKQPKRSDDFAAIQTAHSTAPLINYYNGK